MSNAANDEKSSKLMDMAGLEGYGFWWRMVEIVAAHTEKDTSPEISYSVKKWCALFGVHHHKFKKLIHMGAECGLYELETCELPLGYPDATPGLPRSYSGGSPDGLPSIVAG
ncbi:MAG: hypothetical protein LBC94_00025 [Desulfovibrio sp.]|nr:hypothetical protein [Desulfovibrio sp.]